MAVNYPGRPLHLGDRGDAVRHLQAQLNTYDGDRLAVDGDFGPATAQKVGRFQARRRLGSDGAVDRVIWHAIFRLPPPPLHPRRRETPADRLRRWRVELQERSALLHKLGPGRRRRAVRRRRARLARAIRGALARSAAPRILGARVHGGTPGQAVRAAADEALRRYRAGRRPSFYSQVGAWTVRHALGGEPHGYRSDCSQWVTSIFWACGLSDPNGNDYRSGFTGTLASHGEEIAWAQAQLEVKAGTRPVLVIWDPWGPAGHVEVLMSAAGRTIGHGSTPIAEHTISTFNYKPGGPRFYRY